MDIDNKNKTEHIQAKKLYLTVWISFDDGTTGEVDLTSSLNGPMFEPLKAPHIFKSFFVDPNLETIAWPNGADFAPEFLKELYLQQNQ